MSSIQSIRRVCLGTIGLAAAVAFIAGCDEIDKMNEDAAKRPVIGLPPQVDDAPGNQKDSATKQATAPAATNPAPAANANPTPPDQTNPPPEKLAAGMGAQGQGLGGGIITEPIHQYFMMRDQIKISQLQHQLDIWKAAHNFKNPKNKDEYMREIVEACQVELPELPPGHRYIYDAQKGELQVESGGPAK